MNIISTSTQSGGLRINLNVSTRVPTEVVACFLSVGSTVFKSSQVKFAVKFGVEDDVGFFFE
jgi:hypothetical protein